MQFIIGLFNAKLTREKKYIESDVYKMKQSLGNLYGYTTPPGADGLLVTGFTLTKDAQDLRIQVDDVTVWYGSAKANEKIELHTLVGSDGFSIEYTSLSTKESIPGTLFFRPH